MKHLLLILLLILTGCEKPLEVKIVEPVTDPVEPNVYNMPLIKRQELFFKPYSVETFTGENRVWYQDGQLKESGSYKDGMHHGLMKLYREDGSEMEGSPKCFQRGELADLSISKQ